MQFGKTNFYILKYRTPIKCDLFAFTDRRAIKYNDRVRITCLDSGYLISTIFLGVDHDFGGRSFKPILFETMISKNGQWVARGAARLLCIGSQ